MDMTPRSPKWIIDGALIDISWNIGSFVNTPLVLAVKVVNMKRIEQNMGNGNIVWMEMERWWGTSELYRLAFTLKTGIIYQIAYYSGLYTHYCHPWGLRWQGTQSPNFPWRYWTCSGYVFKNSRSEELPTIYSICSIYFAVQLIVPKTFTRI